MKKKITLLVGLSTAAIATTCVTIATKGKTTNLLTAEGCTHEHVEHHEAVLPGILNAGHMEYWCCCDCHKSFSDSEFKNVIENTEGNPTDPTDGRFTGAATGKMVSESAICSNGASYERVSERAPEGFSYVNKLSVDGDRGDTVKYSTVLVGNYEKLTFAIKCNGYLLLDGWGSYVADGSWAIVEVTNLGSFNYTVDFKNESGSSIYTNSFTYPDNAGTGYVIGGLNSVMFRACTYASSQTDSFYVTELIGSKRAVTGTVVDVSAYSANGVSYTESSAEVPNGFARVNEIGAGGEFVHGQYFSAAPLKKYESVTFALRSSGYILLQGWDVCFDSKDNWAVFTLTNNFDDTFDLVVKDMNGAVLYTKDNISAIGAGPAYTPYALNTILYGGSVKIKPSKKDGYDLTLFASEVRGVLAAVPVVGTKIDDCAISANGVGMSASTMAVPGGYEQVFEKTFIVKDAGMHGQFYSALDLRNYSEVHFALKTTGTFYFDDWGKSNDKHGWLFFSLTNNGDNTFNLEVKDETDAVVCTATNLSSYKGEDPGVYANYALNTILYGNPGMGYSPRGTDITVYATELRGTLAD